MWIFLFITVHCFYFSFLCVCVCIYAFFSCIITATCRQNVCYYPGPWFFLHCTSLPCVVLLVGHCVQNALHLYLHDLWSAQYTHIHIYIYIYIDRHRIYFCFLSYYPTHCTILNCSLLMFFLQNDSCIVLCLLSSSSSLLLLFLFIFLFFYKPLSTTTPNNNIKPHTHKVMYIGINITYIFLLYICIKIFITLQQNNNALCCSISENKYIYANFCLLASL